MHIPVSYNFNLVTLSVIIAIVSAYTVVDLTERVAKSRGQTWSMISWLFGGSISLGLGIWSMHFVGMLALRLPMAIHYNSLIVLISILPAVVASGIALWITSRQTLPIPNLLIAGLLMGLGITAMHYTGMAAMRLSADLHYNPIWVTLSVGVAVVVSLVALWLTHNLQNQAGIAWWPKIAAALVMGLAIPMMHYTGMAAVSFKSIELFSQDPLLSNTSWLASLISAITFALLGGTLLIAAETKVVDRTKELADALSQVKQSQLQLVQSEKMSALGQLVAGIAHEINNPINFIYGNICHLDDYSQVLLKVLQDYQIHYPNPPQALQETLDEVDLDFLSEDLVKLIQSMEVGSQRIQELVLSLRNFSRLDEAEFKAADLHEGIDNTLLILQHRLKEKSEIPAIEVVKDYGQLPLIECFPGQLNQVFTNLLANAIDALQQTNQLQPGAKRLKQTAIIWISTQTTANNQVKITIADNGPGIPELVKSRIFDPFFTTKPVNKGTGLGLSISYQIVVEKHHGEIWCDSTPGEGTKFVIQIPIHQSKVVMKFA